MFMILLIVVLVGLCNGQGEIDYSRCVDLSGRYGEVMICPEGYVTTELCASGGIADCSGMYHRTKCCAIKAAKSQLACHEQNGGNGQNTYCAARTVATSICTSGTAADCGFQTFTRLTCCDEADLGITISSNCDWTTGRFGDTIRCGDQRVIQGVCSSGFFGSCAGGRGTAVYCCGLVR